MAASSEAVAAPTPQPQRFAAAGGLGRRTWDFVRKQPLGAFGAAVVLLLIIVGLVPSLFAPYQYDEFDVTARLQGPSSDHWFGTDQLGRDIFSRVIYGARTSVFIGFGAVAIATVVSTTFGVVSGYYGGWFDFTFQRFIDVWLAFPGLIFVVFVVSIFGNSTQSVLITLGVLFAAGSSRVVRSATLSVRQNVYIEAAKAVGVRDWRIILRYILPNVFPVIIINASVQVGAVILIESSLSFLGFGTPPPFPSWGRMLQEAQSQMQQHPYLAVFPGAAITLTVYAFNMFGDSLRDVLDPRMRGAR
jgi:peptide/nickel transport system permease protein